MINFRSKLLIIIKRANRCESSRRGLEDVRGPRLRCGGAEGRRGTAQVAARIDRPGCALQYRRRDQATHLLAEHHDTVWIQHSKSIAYCSCYLICHLLRRLVVVSARYPWFIRHGHFRGLANPCLYFLYNLIIVDMVIFRHSVVLITLKLFQIQYSVFLTLNSF